MKRTLSITVQWLLVAAIAAGVIYSLVQPVPPQDYQPESWRSWRGFLAISYAGVGSKASGRYASSATLADHLDALTAAGYKTIGPADVVEYLDGKRALPEKAVLLLFESGRKDSFVRATPLLRRKGMRATMCVPTSTMRQWGRFYLKEGEVAKAVRMSEWTFASMGHRAMQDAFTTKRIAVDGRTESDAAFEDRIRDDYSEAARLLANAAGNSIATYFYPYGNDGTGPESDRKAAEFNRDAVRRFHRIAFSRPDDAFNDRNRDPHRLGYIRANGEWSGAELVEAIERFLPVSLSGEELLKPEHWSMTDGTRFSGSAIAVGADGLAWLRGTIPWTDVDVTARLARHTDNSVPALYVRHTGRDSYLRVTLSANGARIQESALGRVQTLKWHEELIPVNVPQEIRLRVKGNRFWVWLNGKPIGETLPLARTTTVGRIGLGSQGGATMVTAVQAMELPGIFALTPHLDDIPEAELESVRTVLTDWFGPAGTPAITDALRDDLLSAAQAGITTVPVIRAPADLTPIRVVRLAEQIDSALAHPVYRTLIDRLAVVAPADGLVAELTKLGWNVINIVDADRQVGQISAPQNGGMVLFQGEPEAVRRALDGMLRICPAQRIAAALPDNATLPPGVQHARVTQPASKESR